MLSLHQDTNVYRNPQRVLECLQRGLKIADACNLSSSANVHLFVEILDYYVYYYEIQNPAITDKFVSGLIALINEHFDSIGVTSSTAVSETKAYYMQILSQIKKKKVEECTKERFCLIVC
jgi:vacuolar protein sorting-associated protein 35